ncbi:cell envelope integrity protein CreD [Nemorincola caseinilytica]|uniref:Cell envelope integrity protein CreD n=1 Tax=Nemorincola caseinilytica TaxID=2054315 RepID=A0ABP8NFW0_9BACT
MRQQDNGNRIFLKGLVVAGLVIAMLIPGVLIMNLVQERQKRQEEVVKEVCSKWADEQTLTGPVLMIPYTQEVSGTNGVKEKVVRRAYILPEELRMNGNIIPKVKKRSLYNVHLYQADIQVSGKFDTVTPELLGVPAEDIRWNEARLLVNVSDMKGMDEQMQLEWNGEKRPMESVFPVNDQFEEGMSAVTAVAPGSAPTFAMRLNVRGSRSLYLSPTGRTTVTDIASAWKDPAFDGRYLPATSDITDDKFTAHWKVSPLVGNFPQVWKNGAQKLSAGAYGVRLIESVDGYAKVMRCVKYAILFVALTFTFFFFLEILQKRRIHPIQYALVGIALIVFYCLLLSISEYAGFNAAYLIASVATVSLITFYVRSLSRSMGTVAGFSISLTALYAYIFVLILSEDHALLFGSIGLFCIVAVIMHFSRRIEWYGPAKPGAAQDGSEDSGPYFPQV